MNSSLFTLTAKSSCLIALSISLSSCFSSKKEAAEKPVSKHELRLIGRIASVPADKRFVLIQSYNGRPSLGTTLTTRGANQSSANLTVTGESLGQYSAADLQSGNVEVGDAVYEQTLTPPKKAEPAPPKVIKS